MYVPQYNNINKIPGRTISASSSPVLEESEPLAGPDVVVITAGVAVVVLEGSTATMILALTSSLISDGRTGW